jgi:hypothetical protein
MSDTQPIDVNSAALGIGRHVSRIADPFSGHIDEFRHLASAFAAATAEEHEGAEPPPPVWSSG